MVDLNTLEKDVHVTNHPNIIVSLLIEGVLIAVYANLNYFDSYPEQQKVSFWIAKIITKSNKKIPGNDETFYDVEWYHDIYDTELDRESLYCETGDIATISSHTILHAGFTLTNSGRLRKADERKILSLE